MVPVMQPNMQGMMGMNFGGQMPPGAIPMQVSATSYMLCLILCLHVFFGGRGQINISLRIYLFIYLCSCSILSELANLAAFGAYIVVKHCCIDLTDFARVEGWI